MEPQIPQPNLPPRFDNSEPKLPAVVPESFPAREYTPEQGLDRQSTASHERLPQPPGAPSNDTATLTSPIPIPASSDDTTPPRDDSSTTLGAANDDVIEKEWINKAKKIVSETKGDPYRQEQEVSKLQAVYMLKRYGRQVKTSEDA